MADKFVRNYLLRGAAMLAFMLGISTSFSQVIIQFDLPFFNANPTTNRTITVNAASPFAGNTFFAYSGTNSTAYLTNAPVGLLNCVIKAPPAAIPFQLNILASDSGVVNASNRLASGQASTYPAGQVSWAIATSDTRYQFATNGSAAQSFYPLYANPSNYVQNPTLLNSSNFLYNFSVTNPPNLSIASGTLNLQQIIVTTPGALSGYGNGLFSTNGLGYIGATNFTTSNNVASIVPLFTNGLATTNFVTSQGFVTAAVTNGLATTNYVNTATNNLTTAYINAINASNLVVGLNSTNFALAIGASATNYAKAATNGLASGAFAPAVTTNGFVGASVTNGLATTNYVQNITNGFVSAAVTNGLATTNYVVTATNTLASTNWVLAQGYLPTAGTNGFVTASVTNGLATTNFVLTSISATNATNLTVTTNLVIAATNALASTNFVNAITNGLATTSYVLQTALLNGAVNPYFKNSLLISNGALATQHLDFLSSGNQEVSIYSYGNTGFKFVDTVTGNLKDTYSSNVFSAGQFSGLGSGITNAAGNGYVDSNITNGLATTNFVIAATNGFTPIVKSNASQFVSQYGSATSLNIVSNLNFSTLPTYVYTANVVGLVCPSVPLLWGTYFTNTAVAGDFTNANGNGSDIKFSNPTWYARTNGVNVFSSSNLVSGSTWLNVIGSPAVPTSGYGYTNDASGIYTVNQTVTPSLFQAITNTVNSLTNLFASTNYVTAATNGLVTAAVTNGLATTNFVIAATNKLATTNFVNSANVSSATNAQFVTAATLTNAVTNFNVTIAQLPAGSVTNNNGGALTNLNAANFTITNSSTSTLLVSTIYTNNSVRSLLAGEVYLQITGNSLANVSAYVTLYVTNNGTGYVRNIGYTSIEDATANDFQSSIPFVYPLDPGATFQFVPTTGAGITAYVTNTFLAKFPQ